MEHYLQMKTYGKQFEIVLRNKMKYLSVKQPDSRHWPHSIFMFVPCINDD